jgi:hypothetical protein
MTSRPFEPAARTTGTPEPASGIVGDDAEADDIPPRAAVAISAQHVPAARYRWSL